MAKLQSAWSAFIHGENPVLAEPLIQRSWLRSREMKVNYRHIEDNDILPTALFQERSGRAENFLRAAKPVLPLIFNVLPEKHHIILLSDQDGYILESMGTAQFLNPSFLNKSLSVHLNPGASWREAIKGTNAIGTALIEKAPVRVIGSEHFVRENHFLGCWAAPIKDPDCNTLGVLDISGHATRSRDGLLDIVQWGAHMIEYNLRLLEFEQRFHLYSEGLRLTADLTFRHELKVDKHGVITEITQNAASLLKIKPESARGAFIGDLFQRRFIAPNFPGTSGFTSTSPSHLASTSASTSGSHSPSAPSSPSTSASTYPPATASGSQSTPGNTPSFEYFEPLTNLLWVGSSEASRKVLQRAAKVATTQTSILLQGESGTGKEIIARHIHLLSSRRNGTFVALNCSALPDSLVESELFGYDDGAFTGAKRGGKPGKFELAQGGTIFLDEIGDISPNVQVALLRVLQEKEIFRIGSSKAYPLDVRIIAATHRDLAQYVQNGKFRLDLFYRLKVITIDLPPLRERIHDVLDLVPHFLRKFNRQTGKIMEIHPDVYSAFLAHTWPGNVRELENCIESMCALAEGSELTVADLPAELSPYMLLPASQPQRSTQLSSTSASVTSGLLRRQEQELIVDALNRTGGKIAPAARQLGIGRNTLYRKMKELGIRNS